MTNIVMNRERDFGLQRDSFMTVMILGIRAALSSQVWYDRGSSSSAGPLM